MGSDTTEPTRYDPDITDRLRHEDSMNPDRSEYRHEVLGRAASEIEALREQLRQAEESLHGRKSAAINAARLLEEARERALQAEQDRDVLGAEARASREHERIVSLPLFDPTNPDFPNPHRDVKRARAMLAVFMTQTNLSGALTRCGPVPVRDLTLCPHGHSRTLECEDCKPASGGEVKR